MDGKADVSHGIHVSYGTSAAALGTSSAGSATTVSRSDHVHALPALTSCTGTLSVAKGGTGVVSITSGNALIGNGTGAITSRAITNNTSATATLTRNTNLITANTLSYFMNRTSAPSSSNTGYSTSCVRAIAAGTSAPTALNSGCIFLVYQT